jgi:hypothetical protein
MSTGLSPSGAAVAKRATTSKGMWVVAYCLAANLPLAAVLMSSPPGGRGLVLELASALGIVARTRLALQMALPARLGVVARPLGAEVAIACTGTWPTSAGHPRCSLSPSTASSASAWRPSTSTPSSS